MAAFAFSRIEPEEREDAEKEDGDTYKVRSYSDSAALRQGG